MYVSPNFKTKKQLKEAVAAGKSISYYQPAGIGDVPKEGTIFVEGPHYPEPHKWYAKCTVKEGKIVKVV